MSFNKNIIIGSKKISHSDPVFIIAEAGVNHGGDINLAKQLIDIATDSGADAVKFQAFRTEHLILKDIQKAPYQTKTTDMEESQTEMLKKLEIAVEQYSELKEYCQKQGILFLITPFDQTSLIELEEIGLDAYKVASTDTTNLPFLKKIAQTGKPIILSTGMCYLNEVRLAMKEIQKFNKDVILLQCTANYPINDNEANLKVINTYIDTFDCIVGYSDHSIGLGASPFAVPMGARVVEKHFTINKLADGPDHLASLNPEELKDYVKLIRQVENYLGSEIKCPTNSEEQTRKSLQKCMVAKIKIKKGDVFSEENLVAKRTGGIGISPIHYQEIVGKTAGKDFAEDDIIYV